MGYKATEPTVYIVEWPAQGVVKIGVSGCQRWKPFVARGGRVLALEKFSTAAQAYQRETELQARVSHRFPSAFNSKHEADEILGSGGGGFLECFVANGPDFMEAINGR